MDLSASTLMAHLLVGVVGFAFFRYGKKQERPVHVVTGVAMMTLPCFGGGAFGVLGIGAGLAAADWVGVRAGL